MSQGIQGNPGFQLPLSTHHPTHPPSPQNHQPTHSPNKNKDPVIVSFARTPVGKFQGGLATQSAPQLGATAIKAAVDRACTYTVIMWMDLCVGPISIISELCIVW